MRLFHPKTPTLPSSGVTGLGPVASAESLEAALHRMTGLFLHQDTARLIPVGSC